MALSWNNPSVKLEGEGEKDDEDLNLSDANDPVTVVIDGEEEAEQRRNKDRKSSNWVAKERTLGRLLKVYYMMVHCLYCSMTCSMPV